MRAALRVVVAAIACRSSARTAASSPAARSSTSRSPRWTWPSSRPSAVGRNAGAAAELARAADVVQQRGGEQQVGAQPRVELRRLAAERGDADRVLEQPAGVGVVRLGGRQRTAAPRGHRGRRGAAPTTARGPGARSRRRGSRGTRRARRRRGASPARARPGRRRRGLDRAHLELEPVAEALDAAEHAHGVALGEAPVEQLDVVPDPRLDPPARVDELEREVGRALLRSQPLLARDRVDALDHAVLDQLGDRCSRPESKSVAAIGRQRSPGLLARDHAPDTSLVLAKATTDRRPADADAIADAFIPSFESLTFLPMLHTHEEHRAHVRERLLGEQEVWVAEPEGRIVGFAALTDDMLTNLYVHPECQGRVPAALSSRRSRSVARRLHVLGLPAERACEAVL